MSLGCPLVTTIYICATVLSVSFDDDILLLAPSVTEMQTFFANVKSNQRMVQTGLLTLKKYCGFRIRPQCKVKCANILDKKAFLAPLMLHGKN
jgi:hypothetical protein